MSGERPKKIIGLIEDKQHYRDLFLKMFEPHRDSFEIRIWTMAEEFLRDRQAARLDVLYVDYELPHMNGGKLIEIVHRKLPEISLVMWTIFAQDEIIYQALGSGAVGYLWKTELADIVPYTEMILDGGAAMSPSIALRVIHSFRDRASADEVGLTNREQQILELIVDGHSNRKVAEILSITFHTARTHVRNIYRKLEVQNQLQLMRKAAEMGLL